MRRVKFNLKDKKAKETLIYLIYRFNGKRLKMSTGIKVNPKHWNSNQQLVREVKGFFEYIGYNEKLKRLEQAVGKTFTYFEIRNENPSILEFKGRVHMEIYGHNDLIDNKPRTVLAFLDEHIKHAQQSGLKKGTIEGFIQLKKVLQKMPNASSLEFKDLNSRRMEEMVTLMIDTFNYSTDQINKIQKKLITVVNRAKQESNYEINKTFYTRSPKWKVKAQGSLNSGRGLAFTSEELLRIEELNLSPRLERVRDRFLIGINTGQRYSDFSRLTKEHVITENDKLYWDFVQQKTGLRIKILVNAKCKEILKKYDGNPPSISLQKFNKYLKEICSIAEINEEQIIRKSNPRDGVVSEKRVPKWQLASSHDCRRTLATILHKKGHQLTTIRRITGHKSIRELEKYLRIDLNAPVLELENIY